MNVTQNAALVQAREILGEHFDDIVVVARSEADGREQFFHISSSNHFVTLGMLEAAAADIRATIINTTTPSHEK